MKLVTFDSASGLHTGAVVGDAVVDLTSAGLPAGMIELIANWSSLAGQAQRIVETRKPEFKLSQIHLRAPVPNPQKILAIGLNYADHIAESGQPRPEKQIWFSKLPNSVNGPYDPIELPKASSAIDYEAELVVVIGKRCRHVSKADAAGVVFGYAAGNDVSVRDWQFHTAQWIVGKSFDTHAPVGPWIVTSDELGDPHTLGIRCLVNGELRQNSNTGNLVFNVYDQIAYLSQAMTLLPGDMIFTGTPGGVGMAMKPPSFLKSGDVVRVEIDRIGALEATMRPEN
ncbi:MAG: fumarylacetoacetate hydrolase family protein [Rhizomicrobium sp.]|jgi:2-keto-4-pentenoate hydratase/2-oxohepta-3-ene-1,7-dioic acid hydratase in catechol pathway